MYPESEDGHFYLGKYYDKLMSVLASDRPMKTAYVWHLFVLCCKERGGLWGGVRRRERGGERGEGWGEGQGEG